MKKLIFAFLVAFAVAAAVAFAGGFYFLGTTHGFSARQSPTGMETMLARRARHLAISSADRAAVNPVALTPEVLVEARRHFADHCASCHSNDGSGDSEIGRNLFPRAPDMRQRETQSLSDGEIYYIIHNGVRMSGMPAWGPDSGPDNDSWALVHFIRYLPKLTQDEVEDMKHHNPMSLMEMQEQKEDEEFLNGKPQK